MTTFANFWLGLKQTAQAAPYLLIDCAGIEGGEARIPKSVFTELECLFTGDLADELADVGPYLGRLTGLSDEVGAVVEDLLDRQVALLVTLGETARPEDEVTFAQLHRHFRKFNVVYGADSAPLFFRYYDPRVLPDVLGVLDEKQLKAFFGPIDSLVLAQHPANVVRCFRRGAELAVVS